MHSYGNVSIAGEEPMLGAYVLGTGRGLYRAIPTMTRVLGLHNLGCWGPFVTWILTGSREDRLNKLNLSKRAPWFREKNQRWQAKIHHFRLVKFKQTTLQDSLGLIVRTQLTSLEYFYHFDRYCLPCRRDWLNIWWNLSFFFQRMICVKFDWNWLSG